jgi:uncharacterized protein YbcV (DUF1398 family)
MGWPLCHPRRDGESKVSEAIDNLNAAMQRAMAGRPEVGGFPYLAETLRRTGVKRNLWFLPACQSFVHGPVVNMGTPAANGTVDVPHSTAANTVRILAPFKKPKW